MSRNCRAVIPLLGLLFASVGLAATPTKLFEKPVPLLDKAGKPMITGKSHGCPYVADYNQDGKPDVVLAAKENMNTSIGKIWIIPNEGSASRPAFSWSSAVKVKTFAEMFRIDST